jgi:hypothetical protein
MKANQTVQRIEHERRGCNPRFPRARSLSLSPWTTASFMRMSPLILLIALLGCSHSETPNAASQMSQQIQQWVPKGTSVTAARQIMQQHQFVCTVGSYDSRVAMPTGSDPVWWDVGSFIGRDGKTMPVTNVTILTCKLDSTNEAYDVTLSAVNSEMDGRLYVSSRRLR